MAYGPLTTKHLGALSAGELFAEAGFWNPDDYTLPFPERLAENISEYYEIPAAPKERNAEITALIRSGAEKKGVKISRSTLNEWLSGGRDPSVSSSDQSTRDNIYRLAAALDYDYEQTRELFEKVFFTRAFNPKNINELAFYFFAVRDDSARKPGCSWYRAGAEIVSALNPVSAVSEEKPITDSVYIINEISAMDQAAFIRFLSSHPATFDRKNENAAGREAVKKSALEACRLIPEIGKAVSPQEIPYDPLIGTILAYSQRNTTMASNAVSSLKSLPPQLTTNFPTGPILRKICLDEACSYDQVYKMLCLLLFCCYYYRKKASSVPEQSFRDFLRFANMSLDRAGFPALYPHQPYGGLLLFCAAQDNPPEALQRFLAERMEEESEAILQEEIRTAFPDAGNRKSLAFIRAVDRNPALVRLTIGTLQRPVCKISLSELADSSMDEEEFLQLLYENANFSVAERNLLRAGALLPADGITDELMKKLFDGDDLMCMEALQKDGWFIRKKNLWMMDYRIRRTVHAQLDFPNAVNCRAFIERVRAIDGDELTEKERNQLDKLKKRIRAL